MLRMTVPQLCVLSSLMGQDRYGLEIIKIAKEEANITIILGSLYNILGKLERDGYVESYWQEGTPERGGHRRRYYKITGAGEHALKEVQSGLTNMWNLALS